MTISIGYRILRGQFLISFVQCLKLSLLSSFFRDFWWEGCCRPYPCSFLANMWFSLLTLGSFSLPCVVINWSDTCWFRVLFHFVSCVYFAWCSVNWCLSLNTVSHHFFKCILPTVSSLYLRFQSCVYWTSCYAHKVVGYFVPTFPPFLSLCISVWVIHSNLYFWVILSLDVWNQLMRSSKASWTYIFVF